MPARLLWVRESLFALIFIFALASPIQCAQTVLSADPSYLVVFPDAVWFLQWTESSGHLTGQIQRVYTTPNNPLTVQSDNEQLTGVRNGADLSLNPGGTFSSVTWTGSIRGSSLTLTIPTSSGLLATVRFVAATADDYNKAASIFRARIAQDAAIAEKERLRLANIAAHRRAVTEADDAVDSALRSLSYDARHLAGLSQESRFQPVMRSYAAHWAKMQSDYEILKSHAAKLPFNCYQLSTVRYDLSTLEYDMSSIRYDNSSFGYVRNPIDNGLRAVADDVARAQSAVTHLQSVIVANVESPPRGGTVYLENYSTGNAVFYLDGRPAACTDPSGCTLVLQGTHRLYAVTSGPHSTPEVTLAVKDGGIYRYLACGAMGNPGQNCGLFLISTPALVDTFVLKANQQLQRSQKLLESAAPQMADYNQKAEALLGDARDFVSSLTCIH